MDFAWLFFLWLRDPTPVSRTLAYIVALDIFHFFAKRRRNMIFLMDNSHDFRWKFFIHVCNFYKKESNF